MPTNLESFDCLIRDAQKLGDHKTKKEAVTAALEEYIQRRKQLKALELIGSIDFDPAYDSKAKRRKKP